MQLVIDASNIRKGGGVTHLQEVLNVADFKKHGFTRVTVWAPQSTLDRIGEAEGLERRSHPLIEKTGIYAYWFRRKVLDTLIDPGTALLWCPGGTCNSKFRPYVTMVRNFLPFIKEDRDRYKYSKDWLRLMYLRWTQARSFKHASGLIYISHKSEEVITRLIDLESVTQKVIYHGLNHRFLFEPRAQVDFAEFSNERPVRILYVSGISYYKHHGILVKALARIRAKGIPIQLDLVGPAHPGAKVKFDEVLAQVDPGREWVIWHGEMPYAEVQSFYRNADLYAFMSSCETFGNILLEAMATGLPIVCSNRSALPEIHAGACVEVDPEDVDSVVAGFDTMIRDKGLREQFARAAFERAQTFSWAKCADETFIFLANCAKDSPQSS